MANTITSELNHWSQSAWTVLEHFNTRTYGPKETIPTYIGGSFDPVMSGESWARFAANEVAREVRD